MEYGSRYVGLDLHRDTSFGCSSAQPGKVDVGARHPTSAAAVLELLELLRGQAACCFEKAPRPRAAGIAGASCGQLLVSILAKTTVVAAKRSHRCSRVWLDLLRAAGSGPYFIKIAAHSLRNWPAPILS